MLQQSALHVLPVALELNLHVLIFHVLPTEFQKLGEGLL
jgi:hypothetical protein